VRTRAATTTVPAIVHAAKVLRYLARERTAMGVTAIARETGISPSSCLNILRTLTQLGFLALNPADKTYSLGIGLAEIASGLIGAGDIRTIRPALERIADGYKVLLAVWHIRGDERVVLIDSIQPDTPVRLQMQLAQRLPAFAGAIGRCLAAATNVPDEQLRRHFAAIRWQMPVTFESYRQSVHRARTDGFAIDEGALFRGITSVAAVVRSHGPPRFGISGVTITGQLNQKELRRLGADLRDAAA
jgi:DNA-binding IclR family transcriptional regulator